MSMSVDYNKRRWIVLIASCIVNICIGTGFAWSVFQVALVEDSVNVFGAKIPPASIALAFTICSGVAPIPMIAGGGLQKKYGPCKVITFGGILFSLGFFLTSFMHSTAMLYVTYGLLCGFGIAFAYGITIGNTVRFFPDKRGMAAGTSTMAYGMGSIIMPPIIQALIKSGGVLFAFRMLGIAFLIIICIAARFVCEAPAGWLPDGYVPPKPKPGMTKTPDKVWTEMLKDGRFYLMFAVFLVFATAGLMVVSQGGSMAKAIGGATSTAFAVSMIGVANSLGRLVWGSISDKIGRYKALILMSIIVAVGAILLSSVNGSLGMFLLFAMLIAACYGGSMGVYPAMTADTFGIKNNGVNYGIMFIAFALGGYIGPILATSLKAATNSYVLPLQIVAVMGVVALLLMLVLNTIKKNLEKKALNGTNTQV